MPPPEAATRHYLEQKAVTAGFVRRIRRIWAELDPGRLDESWRAARISDRLFVATSAGQQLAAGQADQYLDRVLAEQDIDIDRTATVVPRSFAGVASDGRNLEQLLYEPVIRTKMAIGTGAAPAEALRSGEASLVRIVATQLQDAGRAAVGVAIAARPAVTSYARMLVPPSCARCAILAGRVYRYSTGFQRHPACDCRHIPTTENIGQDITTDPRSYFDSLSAEDQARYFTRSGAEAIRSGADIGQVVNARRGMYRTVDGRRATREGTIRGRSPGFRLMPEQILADAADRDEALALLERYGYMSRSPVPTAAPAPPVPVRVTQPNELPSSILTFQNDKARRLFGDTVSQLDELHRIEPGVLPPTRIVAGGKSTAKGGHFSPGARPPKPRRIRGQSSSEYMDRIRNWRDVDPVPEIRVNDRGDGTGLMSFLHEFGHRIDYRGSMRFHSQRGDSAAVTAFQAAAKASSPIVDAYKNFKDFGYVQYFRSDHEIWARAYSQWSANKLGGPHRAALDAMRAMRGANARYQWTDEEFDTLAPLIESVLRERGLL